jgi:SAM-dependent methyltransferase
MEFTGERLILDQASPAMFWEHMYRYKFALNYVRNLRVLDIASGEGYGLAALSEAGPQKVIGIDVSEAACRHAKLKYGLDFRVGDAQKIPLESGSIDFIISFETIEHIENPDLFLSECVRILAKNGKMIFSTPNKNAEKVKKDNEFHVRLYDLEEMVSKLSLYYSKIKIYSQCPETISILSGRYLAALRAPLRRYNTYVKFITLLRRFFCNDQFDNKKTYYFRTAPIKAIKRRDPFYAKFLNPYIVMPYTPSQNEIPMFFIFEVSGKKI